MKIAIIIPARYQATRLPGKLLLRESGKPLVQHTWEQACRVRGVDQILIAADDKRIVDAVRGFGGDAVMTATDHTTGSSRIAEAAQNIDADLIINLQGDEPDIDPHTVEILIDLHKRAGCFASTLACPFPAAALSGPGSPADPSAVKVVISEPDQSDVRHALYFSRANIPYADISGDTPRAYIHIGIYAYNRDSLQRFAAHRATPLELAERLEQLRILEMGERIGVALSDHFSPGIDTRADYDRFLSEQSYSKVRSS